MSTERGQQRINSLDQDLLHPEFLNLMDFLDIDGPPSYITSQLRESLTVSGQEHHVAHSRVPVHSPFYDGMVIRPIPDIPRIGAGYMDTLEIQLDVKRRLVHFLYAADQPLTLTQFSVIPAINTTSRQYEAHKILPLQPETAHQYITCWFGSLISFNAHNRMVSICSEGRGQGPQWFANSFAQAFISPEEAHAETLFVCSTYLLLSHGGGGSNEMGGMGFQYSDDNDLSQVMKRLRTSRQTISMDEYPTFAEPRQRTSLQEAHADSPFYSLLEYSTLNWPRHFAFITPSGRAEQASHSISLGALRTVALILSCNFNTWLESLNSILCNSESMALAQAHVLGTLKRWVLQARSAEDEDQTNVKLLFRALHWLTILQSVDILGQVQAVHQTTPGAPSLNRGKNTICLNLRVRFDTLGSFEEVSIRGYDMIANNKVYPEWYEHIMRLISTASEPCTIDHSRRVVFWVSLRGWSRGSLQLECVDLETGLVLGRDNVWTRKFYGWKYRVLVAQSPTHLGLQVVAEKRNANQLRSLLSTHVWSLKDLKTVKLGQGVLGEHWMIDDNEFDTSTLDDASAYPDLYHHGQLVFNGLTLQTPTGTWDLRTKRKLGDPSLKPSLLTVSENGHCEVYAEWDARTNSYFRLFLKDSLSHTTQQLLWDNGSHTGGSINASMQPNIIRTMVNIRYVALSYSGSKLMIQAESIRALNPKTRDLMWLIWERGLHSSWTLHTRYMTDSHEFWPLLKHDPYATEKMETDAPTRILRTMAPICSVHRVKSSPEDRDGHT